MTMLPYTYNIIVAAGSGLRFGGELPKQFCNLTGRPVLMHTIDAFRQALPEGEIIVVLSEGCETLWCDLCRQHDFTSPKIVYGGTSRWESVRNAVRSISGIKDNAVITVHDGARPLVPARVIREAVFAAASGKYDGAVPAVPLTDSVRMTEPDGSSIPLVRERLRAVQTPQAFPVARLVKAYDLDFSPEFTDDASVMSAAGYGKIVLTEGSADNIKITNPDDIAIAEIIIRRTRSGKM